MAEVSINSALKARNDLRGNDESEILDALGKMDYIGTDPISGGFKELDTEKLALTYRQRNIVKNLKAPQGASIQTSVLEPPIVTSIPFERGKAYGGRQLGASVSASPKEMKHLQQESEQAPYMLSHRPASAQGLPAALCEEVFGKFLEDCLNSVPDSSAVECCKRLAILLSSYHSDADRDIRDEVNSELSHFLQHPVTVLKVSGGTCDGGLRKVLRIHNRKTKVLGTLLWVEDKLAFTSTRADPYAEASMYYTDFLNAEIWFEADNSLFSHPSFTLEVVGNSIKLNSIFVGPKEVGNRICVEPLTDGIVCGDFLRAQRARMDKLARTLRALKLAVDSLDKLYNNFFTDPLQKDFTSTVPYPLRDTARFSNPRWLFEDPTKPLVPQKLLFTVKTDQGVRLVKFVNGPYPEKAHTELAMKGLAPELFEVERLPGNWTMVVMEFLSKEKGWESLEASMDLSSTEKVLDAVEECLNRFHQAGGGNWVHCDFRPANLMLRQDGMQTEIKIVDLDSISIAGEDRYQTFLSRDIAWPPGVEPGEYVFQKHDSDLLIRTWPALHQRKQLQRRKARGPVQATMLRRMQVREHACSRGIATPRSMSRAVLW